jgi:hypothetical protein
MKGGRTSVPRAGDASRLGQDTFHQRSPEVSALGANGLDLACGIDEQHFGIFDTFDFHFLLLARLERQRRHVLELVLGHGSDL